MKTPSSDQSTGTSRFDIFFSGNKERDCVSIASFIDAYCQGRGLKPGQVDFDWQKLRSIIGILYQNFPHCDGRDEASPFKRVASLVTYFAAERVIASSFPPEILGNDLSRIENATNAVVAHRLSVKALHGAVIRYGTTGEFLLVNPIRVSRHYYRDLIEALSMVNPQSHFKLVSLIYESLAYRANPNASDPLEM